MYCFTQNVLMHFIRFFDRVLSALRISNKIARQTGKCQFQYHCTKKDLDRRKNGTRAKKQKTFTSTTTEFLNAVYSELINYAKKPSLHFPMFHFWSNKKTYLKK